MEDYSVGFTGWSDIKFGRWQKDLRKKQELLEKLYNKAQEDGTMKKVQKIEKEVEILLYKEET